MKNIKFYLTSKEHEWMLSPVPSSKILPNWWKNKSQFAYGNKMMMSNGETNFSIKRCSPFLDSMISGYTILLSADIYVDEVMSQGTLINWKTDFDIVGEHDINQVPEEIISSEYHPNAFKWTNEYVVETPKGYSCAIFHPSNRSDLPFFTLSGIVETDSHKLPINFPFLLKNNFSGIIEKGTPIATILPFKREDWEMTIKKPRKFFDQEVKKYKASIYGYYKKNSRSIKKYK